MSQEQVTASAPQGVTPLSPEDQKANSSAASPFVALLKATYSSGQFQFEAVFSFDRETKNSLANVKLKLVGANIERANQLLGSLRTKYGQPSIERPGDIMSSAVWYSEGDQISYVSIGGNMVSVDYAPRKNVDNSGL